MQRNCVLTPKIFLSSPNTQTMAFFAAHSIVQLIYLHSQSLSLFSFAVDCSGSHFGIIVALVLFASTVKSLAFECNLHLGDLERHKVDC